MAQRKDGAPAGGERMLTVSEVAEVLRVSPETIRRYLRRGWLKGTLLGGRGSAYRIDEAELRRFQASGAAGAGKGEGLAA